MKYWTTPFSIDKKTKEIINRIGLIRLPFEDLTHDEICLIIYDSPDQIIKNILNSADEYYMINNLYKNYNSILKTQSSNFKYIAAWQLKSTPFDLLIELLINNKQIDYLLTPNSINIKSSLASLLTLGEIISNKKLIDDYLDIELFSELCGRDVDNYIIERINTNIALDGLNILNNFYENYLIKENEYKTSSSKFLGENKSLLKEINLLNKKFKNIKNENSSIKKENLISNLKYEESKKSLNDKEVEINKLASENKKLRNDLSKSVEEKDQIEIENESLQNENSSLKKENVISNLKYEESKKSLNDKEEEINKLASENKKLRNDLSNSLEEKERFQSLENSFNVKYNDLLETINGYNEQKELFVEELNFLKQEKKENYEDNFINSLQIKELTSDLKKSSSINEEQELLLVAQKKQFIRALTLLQRIIKNHSNIKHDLNFSYEEMSINKNTDYSKNKYLLNTFKQTVTRLKNFL